MGLINTRFHMRKSRALLTGLFVAGIAVAAGASLFRGGSAPLLEAMRVTNATSPKMVADAIRLEGAKLSSKTITFTYTLLSSRFSEIDREVWERKIQPQVERDVERAEAQEAKGLLDEGTTIVHRYLDREGHLMAEVVLTQTCEVCEAPSKV